MNFYGGLIQQRANTNGDKIHYFNSFFGLTKGIPGWVFVLVSGFVTQQILAWFHPAGDSAGLKAGTKIPVEKGEGRSQAK